MIVIGVDPGLARVGVGVIRSGNGGNPVALGCECISTSRGSPSGTSRLVDIYDRITTLLAQFSPDELAMEKLFFSKNVTSAMAVSEVRGVVLLAAGQRGIPVAEYAPNQVKQAITGSGRADKRQVQEMITRILGLPSIPTPDDAADALSVALCHLHSMRR